MSFRDGKERRRKHTRGIGDYRMEKDGKQQATAAESTGALFFQQVELSDTYHIKINKINETIGTPVVYTLSIQWPNVEEMNLIGSLFIKTLLFLILQ